MLRFNTFRAKKYLRSKFVEGKFLLASEATDLELEIIDLLRTQLKHSMGDFAVEDSWKVTRVSSTQLLVKPGEAWLEGLPFLMRYGKDHLVSGNLLSSGITPQFVTITDDANGGGKLVTFNVGGSTPTAVYKVVITAQEQVLTDNDDLFLKNANLTEDTAQKIRLIYKINVVSNSLQTETPIPYTNDTNQANLVNRIVVSPTPGGNGELLNTTLVTGSEQIDGRNVELTVRNDSGIGGGNPIPNGSSDQNAFFNGRLIDSNGTEYHLNAVFNATLSTQVILRVSHEVGQNPPEIINGKPYSLRKRDVFVSDDVNGTPQGKLFYSTALVDFNSTSGVESDSKITDLRRLEDQDPDFESNLNQKVDFYITNGGTLSLDSTSTLLTWSAALDIINAYGAEQTIAPNTAALLDGGSLTYEVNFAGGAIGRGNQSVTIGTGGATLLLTGSPDLSQVRLGNVIQASGQFAAITAIDNVNKTLSVSPSVSNTGSATIYRDSFAAGTAPIATKSIVVAVRDGLQVKVAKSLILNAGDSSPLGGANPLIVRQNKNSKLVKGGVWLWNDVSNQLSWSLDAYIQVPGLLDSRNRIPAGNVTLSNDDDVAYVEINRTGSTPATLAITVANIASVALDDNTVIIARKFSGSVIAQQPVHSAGDALNNSNNQSIGNPFVVSASDTITNIEVRLTRVGSPSGNITVSLQGNSAGDPNGTLLESSTFLASSVAANPTETIVNLTTPVPVSPGTYHIVVSSDATYKASFSFTDFISVKRDSATTTAPLEEYFNGSVWSHAGVGALYYIVSTGGTNQVVVGTSSFALRGGEAVTLDGAVPLVNDFFNQLKLKAANPTSTKVIISSPDVTMLTGEKRSQSMVGLLLEMDGAQIDFQTGNIYKADGVTARGINFSPVVPATNMWRWFSIGILPSTTNPDNTIDGQVLVLPGASDGASMALAPRAVFSSGIINLGQVAITSANGTTVTAILQSNIIQLGVGSGSGGGGSTTKVDLYDPVSTTLPSGPSATIDGVSVTNGQIVLFSNLSSGNNRAYKVSGVGTSLSWAVQPIFSTPYDPVNGDQVVIRLGTAFYDQEAMFDGATFNINRIVRHFTGANYWQEESIQESTLLDNTTGNIFTTTALGSENIIVDFSVKRNGIKETGTLWLTNDATNAFLASGSAYSGATGLTFLADINAGNVRLRYTLTSTGSDASFKYSIKRWSDASGGPSGPISYSPSLQRYSNAAFLMSDNSGTPINANPTFNVLGKTRVQMTFTYVVGLMGGTTVGDLEVYVDGSKFPRFVSGATLDGYYKEISNDTIEFYTDISGSPFSIEIIKRV